MTELKSPVGKVLQLLHMRFPPGENKHHALCYDENNGLTFYIWVNDKIYPLKLENEDELEKGESLVEEIGLMIKYKEEEAKSEYQKTIDHLQSQVDQLMLEFCPERMTKAQMNNWSKHQAPTDFQIDTKHLAGYERITKNDQLTPDCFYWVRNKKDKGTFFIAPVRNANGVNEDWKPALIVNNMSFWCFDGNSQALETFEVYGPINQPFHIEVAD